MNTFDYHLRLCPELSRGAARQENVFLSSTLPLSSADAGKRLVPVSFFGMVLGLAGLGNGWRVAIQLWGAPAFIGELILALAVLVWFVLLVFYVSKWLFAREDALAEARHPLMSSNVALVFITTLLVAIAVLPYSRGLATVLSVIAWGAHIVFAPSITAALWRNSREGVTPTAVIYLPTVAGNFVSAMAAGALGYVSLGVLFFGAGLLSWLAFESVLMHHMYTAGPLPLSIRPTLGIQLAPPVVCCVAYLSVNGGVPDVFAQMLFGYGLLQAGIVVRLIPWFREQAFVPGNWAFSFGVVALPLSAMRMTVTGLTGPVAFLALPAFAAANVIIGMFVLHTTWLLLNGRLVPRCARSS